MIYDHDGKPLGETQTEVSIKLGISRTAISKRLIPDGNDFVLRPRLQEAKSNGRKPIQRKIYDERGRFLGNTVVEAAMTLKANTSTLYTRMRLENGVWIVRDPLRRGNPNWIKKSLEPKQEKPRRPRGRPRKNERFTAA